MLNQMNSEPSPVPESGTPKKSSNAVKLIQAAALAAVLVPLGSIAVETSTCTFYGLGRHFEPRHWAGRRPAVRFRHGALQG